MSRFLRWYFGGLAALAEERAERARTEAARIRGRVPDLNHVYDREEIRRELRRADQVDGWANWWLGLAELVPARWRR